MILSSPQMVKKKSLGHAFLQSDTFVPHFINNCDATIFRVKELTLLEKDKQISRNLPM